MRRKAQEEMDQQLGPVVDLGEGAGTQTVSISDGTVEVETGNKNVVVTDDGTQVTKMGTSRRAPFFIAELVAREMGNSEKVMVSRVAAAYQPKPFMKDLTACIWGCREAGDYSDSELVSMAVGDWNYVYADVIKAAATGDTVSAPNEVSKDHVQQILAQRLYEAGVRGKSRVNTIAKSATSKIFGKEGGYYKTVRPLNDGSE